MPLDLDDDDLRVRPHGRALVLPLVVLLVVLGLAGFAAGRAPEGDAQLPVRLGVGLLAALLLVRYAVRPWLRWLTTVLVVTDRTARLESGVLRRRRREVPLSRVVDVGVERSLGQRLVGSGTLVLSTAGALPALVLRDAPRVRSLADEVADRVDVWPLEEDEADLEDDED